VSEGYVPSTLDSRRSGVATGATIGWGWQVGRMVYGLEADGSYARIGGSAARTDPISGAVTTVEADTGWLATVRGRIGRVITQDLMGFLSGGAAFGGVSAKADVRDSGSTSACGTMFVCSSGSASTTAVGWALGAGVEYNINGWASVKTEYLHVDLGKVGATTQDAGTAGVYDYSAGARMTTDMVRSGLNVHF
jgi:opacity protein-like surface antigen